jgi:hypothetical protein
MNFHFKLSLIESMKKEILCAGMATVLDKENAYITRSRKTI